MIESRFLGLCETIVSSIFAFLYTAAIPFAVVSKSAIIESNPKTTITVATAMPIGRSLRLNAGLIVESDSTYSKALTMMPSRACARHYRVPVAPTAAPSVSSRSQSLALLQIGIGV